MWKIRALLTFYVIFSPIVCGIYKPVFFEEEEVRHVRDASWASKAPCNENVLIGFLAEGQITSPEGIIGMAIADFDLTCRRTSVLMKKIEKYLKNCTAPRGLYASLINGLKSFDEKLCKNNAFYKKYDAYDKCISDLDKDYDSCDGTADWIENEEEGRVCKTYKRIIDCYYIKTAKVCGIRAALILKELMTEVMDCTLTVKCHVGKSPAVSDAMPDKYVASLNKGQPVLEKAVIQNTIPSFFILIFYLVNR